MSTIKKFNSKDFSDEDLVDASSATVGAHPSQESLWAQAELTRRLMENIKNFDRSTTRYSSAIIVLTFVLAVVAFLQLTATIFPIPDSLVGRWIIFLTCTGMVVYTFWRGLKEFGPEED